MRYGVTKTTDEESAEYIESWLSNRGYHWSSHLTNEGRRFEITSQDNVGPLNEGQCDIVAGQIGGKVETY